MKSYIVNMQVWKDEPVLVEVIVGVPQKVIWKKQLSSEQKWIVLRVNLKLTTLSQIKVVGVREMEIKSRDLSGSYFPLTVSYVSPVGLIQ